MQKALIVYYLKKDLNNILKNYYAKEAQQVF